MAIYKWAEKNGNIVEADYDETKDTLSSAQVLNELIGALNGFGNTVTYKQISSDLNEVYEVTIPDGAQSYSIVVCLKETTPGGRDTLKDEQRIQQKAKHINYAYNTQQSGKLSIWLGVYKRDGETIFCAWKLKPSNAKTPETPISKQIKISSIAQAMHEGFVQQDKGGSEWACAFRKEFIYFYIKNSTWLHDGIVSKLNEHTVALPETPGIDDDHKDKYNRIIFGAPGTGKSFKLEEDRVRNFDDNHYERVTFHPSYSYAQFVGTYKPAMESSGITYKYVPGPFIRVLMQAIKKPSECQLLLIEEINRANAPAVFGDVFQLLDRKHGKSEFPVVVSEDLKAFLIAELGEAMPTGGKIAIPANMYIWASMNSADQGVFPIDAAFKRRWEFEYLGIDHNSSSIESYHVKISGHMVQWDALRRGINKILCDNCKINEDKLIGPFFLDIDALTDEAKFNAAFKSKVLMYLYEDSARQYRAQLFAGCDYSTYSAVCAAFDTKGEGIFNLSLAID